MTAMLIPGSAVPVDIITAKPRRLPRRAALLFFALALIGIGVRLACLGALPLERLIELWVTDDAFYYFVTAENWAAGFPSTFDREHFTNGYHPLWMGLSVGVFTITGGAGAGAVKFMLFSSIVCQLGASLLIVRLGRRVLAHDGAACLAGGVFLLLPSGFLIAFCGLETTLALMLLLIFFSALLDAWDARRFTAMNALLCGALGGLVFLARTDQVFYLMATWGAAFAAGPGRARVWVVMQGLAALVVVTPWLAWNLAMTGHIVQASASAYPTILVHHAGVYLAGIGMENTFWNRLPHLISIYTRMMMNFVPDCLIEHRVFWATAAGTLAVSLIAGAAPSRREQSDAPRSDGPRPRLGLLLIPVAGLLALTLVHGLLRAYPRYWYFAGVGAVGSLAAGQMFQMWRAAFRNSWLAAALFIAVAAAGLYPQVIAAKNGLFLNQGYHRRAALWANENLPPGARIGAFNAGVTNYYCERPVINLDGTTNNSVMPPLVTKTMWSYIRAEKIDYLIDAKFSIEMDYPIVMDVAGYPDSALERVHRIEGPDKNFEFYVYRVRGGDEISSPALRRAAE